MIPAHVDLYNAAQARANLQRRRTRQRPVKYPKYKVGDYVRISRSKGTFEKGFEKNYSEEIFKVCCVSQRQHIYLYEIQDLNDENINGFFYTEELTGVGSRRLTFRLPDSLYIGSTSDMNFVYSLYVIQDSNLATFKGPFKGSNPGSLKVNS